MEEKIIRISKQINKFLEACSEEELEICSAYYLPNISEIEEYLKQGEYNTQLANLLSGNNPLQKRIASTQIQTEFNELVNQGMVCKLGTDDKYNSAAIYNEIMNLLSIVKQGDELQNLSNKVTSIVARDIKKRIDTNIQMKLNVYEGIKGILIIKLSKSLGLNQNEFDQISSSIEKLTTAIYHQVLNDQYITNEFNVSQEELKKLKNKMYNDPNYLSNILPLPKDKIITKETLVQRVINNIMYKSASNAPVIEVNKQLGCIRINGEVLPITLYDDILSLLKENSQKAFTNINMYLTSNDTVFTDEFQRKYILHLDNTHILGIEKNSKFLGFIIDEKIKFEEIQTKLNQGIRFEDLTDEDKIFYTSWPKKYLSTIQPVSKPKFIGCKNIVFGPKIENISPTLKIMNRLYKLSDNPPQNEKEISEQIEHVNKIQQQINSIMSNQKEDKVFERLVYFLIKDSNNPLEITQNITKEKIKEVIDSNVCVFNNEYNTNFQNDPSLVLSKVLELNNDDLNRIKNKYDEIFSIQDYLNYKYKVISQSVIKQIPSYEWEKYLGGKHDTINGRLDNSKIGLFGIAQLLIENEIDEHISSLKDGKNIEHPVFNLFKVADKTYYIVNFNYVADIKKIFVVDKENGGKTYDIICEMEAFEETLMAYFEEIETNGTARFYSVQNTEDVFMKTFDKCKYGDVIDLENNEHTTILVFAQTSDDQRITQHYTSTKGKILSVNDFIQKILSNDIELRTATSLTVSGDYEKDKKKKISEFFKRIISDQETLSKESMNELSFIGCSNADQMIEEMNIEDIQKFIGIDYITEEEFALVKMLLKQKLFESFSKVIELKMDNTTKMVQHLDNINVKDFILDAEATLTASKVKYQIDNAKRKFTNLINLKNDISVVLRFNNEILSRKDSTGQPIDLNTTEGIRSFINNNLSSLTVNHILSLNYLANRVKAIGDSALYMEIKDICFKLYLEEEKNKFKKIQSEYLTKHNSFTELILSPNVYEKDRYDREIMPHKIEILNRISRFIEQNYSSNPEDTIRYLEIADREISSLVEIKDSISSYTQFETEVNANRQEKTERFDLYATDQMIGLEESIRKQLYNSNLSASSKINNISTTCEIILREIENKKASSKYDASDLIDKYFFNESRAEQKQKDQETNLDDINSIISSKCTILNVVDILLKYLKEDIKDIYDKYVKSGVSLFESEVRDIEKMTNSRKRQAEYIEKIHERIQLYTLTISKLYAKIIKHSGKYDSNRAAIVSEMIEEKLQETRTEIEKKTNSPIFSYVTAELTRNILSDNASPILYDFNLDNYQLRNLSNSEDPVTHLKQ